MKTGISKGIEYYDTDQPLKLELGGELKHLRIAYHTFGRLNERKDNVIWMCHALTANSDVADWLPGTVVEGGFLDPEKWFVVCGNIIGSPYGSTGPLSTNPDTGLPYYDSFPKITIRDMVAAHRRLADKLGIDRIHALVGCSVGGFQAIEWAVEEPSRFDKLVLVATSEKASPWTIAIDETQRMAIKADATWGEHRPDAAMKGLAAARAIALLSYRGWTGYNITQQTPDDGVSLPEVMRPVTYQQYQGEKLCRRYDAYSYITILDAFDTHNIGRGRGGVDEALARISAKAIVIGVTTDIVFPPEELKMFAAKIPDATYCEIQSEFGHDGFLVEKDQLNALLNDFLVR